MSELEEICKLNYYYYKVSKGDYVVNRKFIEDNIERATYILEILIAIAIIVGIIIGLKEFVLYFQELLNASYSETYEMFEAFLAYALVLIVGVELIAMIVNHSTSAILELVLFVIARKMLIYAHTMLDLVFGTLAILIVFVVIKYLTGDGDKDIVRRDKNDAYEGNIFLADIEDADEFNLDEDMGDFTVNEFIQHLAEKEFRPIGRGEIFYSGSKKIMISKEENGKVQEVVISDRE